MAKTGSKDIFVLFLVSILKAQKIMDPTCSTLICSISSYPHTLISRTNGKLDMFIKKILST
jgi:hypothetical protein